jgi:hypothetical protein
MIATARQNEEFFLDLVDGTLQIFRPGSATDDLARLLDIAGSVWTVAPDRGSLVGVVSDEAQATYEAATSVADEATKELKEAWTNAFGRDGDPSDAWEHSIKALEDVLIGAMMPNNGNATLGNVVGELAGQNGAQWKMVLPGNNQDHDVAHLVAMLRLIWPNHDRHGGPTPKRTHAEADPVATRGTGRRHARRDHCAVAPRRLGGAAAVGSASGVSGANRIAERWTRPRKRTV